MSRTPATRDDWQTPPYIIDALGKFDLDPCAALGDPLRCATTFYTKPADGLSQTWTGRVWLNPPYGSECRKWMKKLGAHGDGIALIPPRLGSKWFHSDVLAHCTALFALEGRVAFINPDSGKPVTGNNADSILVAYGQQNVAAILSSGLKGRILYL